MTWQVLIAIGVLTFSVSVILRRVLLKNSKFDSFAYAAVFQGFTGLFLAVIAFSQGFVLPDLSQYWAWMLGAVMLYASGAIVSAYVLKLVEASIFSLLFATSAIWTMLAQFILFQTTVTSVQLCGALLLVASIGVLVERRHFKKNKGILLGILMGMIYGFANVAWAYVAKSSDVASWNALSFLVPALLIMAARPRSIPAMGVLLKGRLLWQMLLIGAVFAASSLSTLYAFSYGNVSIVSVLLQVNIIVTMILGIVFLGEKDQLPRKIVAAILCLGAILLIV
ncbi:MAG TPA: DMT family transporter [Candidatus Saccharimonadales bacterium]